MGLALGMDEVGIREWTERKKKLKRHVGQLSKMSSKTAMPEG